MLLTGVLEVDVVAIESILQAVRHDLQLHYLLPYCHVGLGDVYFHFGVVDLARQAVANDFGEVPGTHDHVFTGEKARSRKREKRQV